MTDRGNVRWINTVTDSETILHDRDGAMHPNIRGQDSIGRHILEEIIHTECALGRVSPADYVHARLCDGATWQSDLPGFATEKRELPACAPTCDVDEASDAARERTRERQSEGGT
jgi:hypothetical protein